MIKLICCTSHVSYLFWVKYTISQKFGDIKF
jgi:hypothetical protein